MENEIFQILTRWADRTEMVLNRERNRLKIGKTGDLDKSFKTRVFKQSQTTFEAQMDFLIRGRFVDMGVGRERKIESQESNRDLLSPKKARKPKNGLAVHIMEGLMTFKAF